MRFFAALFTVLFAVQNVYLAHAAEAHFWEERRQATQPQNPPQFSSLPTPSQNLIMPLTGRALRDLNISSELNSADRSKLAAQAVPQWLQDAVAPFASIQSISLSKNPSAAKILVVQDAHLHHEAQTNIAGLLDQVGRAVQKKGETLLVGLEGADAPLIDFSAFNSIAQRDELRRVATVLMEKNVLTGAELAGIGFLGEGTGPVTLPFQMIGVEDQKLYDANVAAFRAAHSQKEQAAADLNRFQQELTSAKQKVFTPELLQLDAVAASYHEGKMGISDYVMTLDGLTPAVTPELKKLIAAALIEGSLDFAKVERERAALLEQLTKKITAAETRELIAASTLFKSGSVTYTAYYDHLKALCERHGASFAKFPEMNLYVQYVLKTESIDHRGLFSELKEMEASAWGKLAVTTEQKALIAQTREAQLLKKLSEFSLTETEWLEYAAHPTERSGWKEFENFYLYALERNNAMVQKLSFVIARSGATRQSHEIASPSVRNDKVAVLIAGGFHTQGLVTELQGKDFTVLTVSPKITKVDENAVSSLDILASDKRPLDDVFVGDRLFLGVELAIVYHFNQLRAKVYGALGIGLPKNPRAYQAAHWLKWIGVSIGTAVSLLLVGYFYSWKILLASPALLAFAKSIGNSSRKIQQDIIEATVQLTSVNDALGDFDVQTGPHNSTLLLYQGEVIAQTSNLGHGAWSGSQAVKPDLVLQYILLNTKKAFWERYLEDLNYFRPEGERPNLGDSGVIDIKPKKGFADIAALAAISAAFIPVAYAVVKLTEFYLSPEISIWMTILKSTLPAISPSDVFSSVLGAAVLGMTFQDRWFHFESVPTTESQKSQHRLALLVLDRDELNLDHLNPTRFSFIVKNLEDLRSAPAFNQLKDGLDLSSLINLAKNLESAAAQKVRLDGESRKKEAVMKAASRLGKRLLREHGRLINLIGNQEHLYPDLVHAIRRVEPSDLQGITTIDTVAYIGERLRYQRFVNFYLGGYRRGITSIVFLAALVPVSHGAFKFTEFYLSPEFSIWMTILKSTLPAISPSDVFSSVLGAALLGMTIGEQQLRTQMHFLEAAAEKAPEDNSVDPMQSKIWLALLSSGKKPSEMPKQGKVIWPQDPRRAIIIKNGAILTTFLIGATALFLTGKLSWSGLGISLTIVAGWVVFDWGRPLHQWQTDYKARMFEALAVIEEFQKRATFGGSTSSAIDLLRTEISLLTEQPAYPGESHHPKLMMLLGLASHFFSRFFRPRTWGDSVALSATKDAAFLFGQALVNDYAFYRSLIGDDQKKFPKLTELLDRLKPFVQKDELVIDEDARLDAEAYRPTDAPKPSIADSGIFTGGDLYSRLMEANLDEFKEPKRDGFVSILLLGVAVPVMVVTGWATIQLGEWLLSPEFPAVLGVIKAFLTTTSFSLSWPALSVVVAGMVLYSRYEIQGQLHNAEAASLIENVDRIWDKADRASTLRTRLGDLRADIKVSAQEGFLAHWRSILKLIDQYRHLLKTNKHLAGATPMLDRVLAHVNSLGYGHVLLRDRDSFSLKLLLGNGHSADVFGRMQRLARELEKAPPYLAVYKKTSLQGEGEEAFSMAKLAAAGAVIVMSHRHNKVYDLKDEELHEKMNDLVWQLHRFTQLSPDSAQALIANAQEFPVLSDLLSSYLAIGFNFAGRSLKVDASAQLKDIDPSALLREIRMLPLPAQQLRTFEEALRALLKGDSSAWGKISVALLESPDFPVGTVRLSRSKFPILAKIFKIEDPSEEMLAAEIGRLIHTPMRPETRNFLQGLLAPTGNDRRPLKFRARDALGIFAALIPLSDRAQYPGIEMLLLNSSFASEDLSAVLSLRDAPEDAANYELWNLSDQANVGSARFSTNGHIEETPSSLIERKAFTLLEVLFVITLIGAMIVGAVYFHRGGFAFDVDTVKNVLVSITAAFVVGISHYSFNRAPATSEESRQIGVALAVFSIDSVDDLEWNQQLPRFTAYEAELKQLFNEFPLSGPDQNSVTLAFQSAGTLRRKYQQSIITSGSLSDFSLLIQDAYVFGEKILKNSDLYGDPAFPQLSALSQRLAPYYRENIALAKLHQGVTVFKKRDPKEPAVLSEADQAVLRAVVVDGMNEKTRLRVLKLELEALGSYLSGVQQAEIKLSSLIHILNGAIGSTLNHGRKVAVEWARQITALAPQYQQAIAAAQQAGLKPEQVQNLSQVLVNLTALPTQPTSNSIERRSGFTLTEVAGVTGFLGLLGYAGTQAMKGNLLSSGMIPPVLGGVLILAGEAALFFAFFLSLRPNLPVAVFGVGISLLGMFAFSPALSMIGVGLVVMALGVLLSFIGLTSPSRKISPVFYFGVGFIAIGAFIAGTILLAWIKIPAALALVSMVALGSIYTFAGKDEIPHNNEWARQHRIARAVMGEWTPEVRRLGWLISDLEKLEQKRELLEEGDYSRLQHARQQATVVYGWEFTLGNPDFSRRGEEWANYRRSAYLLGEIILRDWEMYARLLYLGSETPTDYYALNGVLLRLDAFIAGESLLQVSRVLKLSVNQITWELFELKNQGPSIQDIIRLGQASLVQRTSFNDENPAIPFARALLAKREYLGRLTSQNPEKFPALTAIKNLEFVEIQNGNRPLIFIGAIPKAPEFQPLGKTGDDQYIALTKMNNFVESIANRPRIGITPQKRKGFTLLEFAAVTTFLPVLGYAGIEFSRGNLWLALGLPVAVLLAAAATAATMLYRKRRAAQPKAVWNGIAGLGETGELIDAQFSRMRITYDGIPLNPGQTLSALDEAALRESAQRMNAVIEESVDSRTVTADAAGLKFLGLGRANVLTFVDAPKAANSEALLGFVAQALENSGPSDDTLVTLVPLLSREQLEPVLADAAIQAQLNSGRLQITYLSAQSLALLEQQKGGVLDISKTVATVVKNAGGHISGIQVLGSPSRKLTVNYLANYLGMALDVQIKTIIPIVEYDPVGNKAWYYLQVAIKA